MKVKVLKRFKDKHTKESRAVGDVLEMEKERMDEINKTHKDGRKYIKFVEEIESEE